MIRAIKLGLVSTLSLILLVSPAGSNQKREKTKRHIGIRSNTTANRDGTLTLIPSGGSCWVLRQTDKGTLIIHDTQGRPCNGWYLRYDPKGKDFAVRLVKEPDPGCYWKWTPGRAYNFADEEGVLCAAFAQEGPLKDWGMVHVPPQYDLTMSKTSAGIFRDTYIIDDPNSGK